MSEKITEFLINDLLIKYGYIDRGFNSKNKEVKISLNKSDSVFIKNLLAKASKNKTDNIGCPDFIIYDNNLKLIILIECKGSVDFHIDKQGLNSFSEVNNMKKEVIKKYAVNGALWYSSFLKNEFNVFSLGISGDKKEHLKISTYFWKKNSNFCFNLNEEEFHDINWYHSKVKEIEDNEVSEIDYKELNEEARKINEFLHDEMRVEEHRRLYVLGTVLLALEVPYFQDQYSNYTNNKELSDFLWTTVERKIKNQKILEKSLVIEELKPVILSLKSAQKEKNKFNYPFGTLVWLIEKIDNTLFKIYKNKELDLLSFFFNIFLQYTTKGGSDLGIVLTPRHITKLFVKLAGIDIKSKVLDICAGTGGFLTAAWKEIALSKNYTNDEKEKFRIDNLYGVEDKSTIFTTAILNMLINNDGKTNLYKKDCFEMKEKIKSFECNFGLLNPPYSDKTYSELEFVKLMLGSLLPKSTALCIVPVNALSQRTRKHDNSVIKKEILENHNLLASIEMPKNLFYPKGVETVVLVFRTSERNEGRTWFARFDDGYELIKHQKSRTPTKKSHEFFEKFVNAYKEKKEGEFSFFKEVNHQQQWVYTILSDVDYHITPRDLQRKVNEYIAFLVENDYLNENNSNDTN